MKCFNEDILQQYIDNELDNESKIAVEHHVSVCSDCIKKLEYLKANSDFVISELSKLSSDKNEIPDISTILPASKKRIYRKLFYVLAVASVLIIGVFYFNNRNDITDSNENDVVYVNDFEFDANKSVTDQDFEIVIVKKEINNNQNPMIP